jgi:hypothetical protein
MAKDGIAQWKAALIVVAVSSGLTLAFVAVLGWTLRGLQDEIKLPLLVVAAVAGLLASLALVVAVFALYQLADKTYALGLPDGSVRAIIALLLIVLFSVTTVFLTVRLQNAAAGAPVVDFAKQILTILGTLMTAVASFYFGTRAVADGAKASQSGPTNTAPPATSQEKAPITGTGGASTAAEDSSPAPSESAQNGNWLERFTHLGRRNDQDDEEEVVVPIST